MVKYIIIIILAVLITVYRAWVREQIKLGFSKVWGVIFKK